MATVNLRWVLMHLLEETARHAGHADILVVTIDGDTGGGSGLVADLDNVECATGTVAPTSSGTDSSASPPDRHHAWSMLDLPDHGTEGSWPPPGPSRPGIARATGRARRW